jgi:hypothetical protein
MNYVVILPGVYPILIENKLMKLGGSLGNVPQKFIKVPSPTSLSVICNTKSLFLFSYLNTFMVQ